MAGASMKDIKNRIKSIENTGQITKAMELVATSKLRHAKEKVAKTRPFFEILNETLLDIKRNIKDFSSIYTVKREINKICYVVIGGDRGLAGGYNQNLFKTAIATIGDSNHVVLPIGKKTIEFFERNKSEILMDDYSVTENVSISDCYAIGRILSNGFQNKEYDKIVIVFTKFVSMLSFEPQSEKILPLYDEETLQSKKDEITIYEPSAEATFQSIVPQYIAGTVYSAINESLTSELAARRTAMESASKNANEMIDDLTLKFNRARQAAITQEITEIVSGSETV